MSNPLYLFFGGLSTRSSLKPDAETGLLEVSSDRNQAVNKAIEARLKEDWPSARVVRPNLFELTVELEEAEPVLSYQNLLTRHVFIADILFSAKDKWVKTEHPTGWATTNKISSILSMEKVRIRTLLPNVTVTIKQKSQSEVVHLNVKFAGVA